MQLRERATNRRRQPSQLMIRFATAAVPLLAFGAAAYAADVHWVVLDGSWDNAANWSPAAVPGAADNAFIDRLQAEWGHDLFAGEFSHSGEHSIEFQAVCLRSLGLAGEAAAPIVPILCDSLHSSYNDLLLIAQTNNDTGNHTDGIRAQLDAKRVRDQAYNEGCKWATGRVLVPPKLGSRTQTIRANATR
jgi:hypothetical protein